MSSFSAGGVGRLLARLLVAAFTATVLLLAQSVFRSDSIPAAIVGLVAVIAFTAYFRPQQSLLIIAGLAPLGPTLGGALGTSMREAEAMVLGFLLGALVRGWTLHQFREFPSSRLERAALLFGTIVALSCAVQLGQSEPRQIGQYVALHYLTSFRGFGAIFSAMLMLEGLALLLFAAQYARALPEFRLQLLRMIVVGAAGAAAVNLWFFAHELLETGEPAARLAEFFLRERWSAHVGDVNAAGSYFAMALFIAAVAATTKGAKGNHEGTKDTKVRGRGWWGTAAALLALALWLTASRTAFAASIVVGIASAVVMLVRRYGTRRTAWAAAVLVPVAVFAVQYFVLARASSAAPSTAMNIRWLFLQTTWRMLEAHPIFGVGIGQYARWSTHYSSPELLAFYARENAHNNFAQVAGELGMAGLAAFVAVLGLAMWKPAPHSALSMAAAAGVAVFVLTWLGGHPLLVPEVAYPFWMALASVSGLPPVPSNRIHA